MSNIYANRLIPSALASVGAEDEIQKYIEQAFREYIDYYWHKHLSGQHDQSTHGSGGVAEQ